ncbi:MAG TPA: hypothetical protein VFX51_25055 [Solirubrobacteraceae bacterium]|nr:hypothetical protein [Solirubrobacteraceae bacterium]
MPKYDAFGREIGDDPLKDLRETTNPAPAETPRVEVSSREPEITTPEPETEAWSGAREPDAEPQRIVFAPPEFVRPRRRRRGFGFAGLLVLVAGIAAIGMVGNSAVEKGQDLIEDFEQNLPDAEVDAAPEAPPPVGLEADSLIREDNFAAAMKTLADSGLGRPTSLRIAPERIDTQLIEGNTLHIVQITPDGKMRDLGSSEGAGRPIAFKAIDPAAPERMVRRGASPKSPPRNINYLVMSPGPPQTVGAYFKSGRIVIGDAHGRPQRVL